MVDWGESSGLNIGGVFEGSMKSEGTGARVKLGINMPFGLPDIPLVNKNVGGLAKGGVIGRGPSRAQAMEASAARRGGTRVNRPRGGLTTSEARGRGPGPRQGGADAPTGRRSGASGSSSSAHVHQGGGGGPAHPLASHARGAAGGGQRRRKHELAPGVPCPSCATGITKPVR